MTKATTTLKSFFIQCVYYHKFRATAFGCKINGLKNYLSKRRGWLLTLRKYSSQRLRYLMQKNKRGCWPLNVIDLILLFKMDKIVFRVSKFKAYKSTIINAKCCELFLEEKVSFSFTQPHKILFFHYFLKIFARMVSKIFLVTAEVVLKFTFDFVNNSFPTIVSCQSFKHVFSFLR